MKDEWQDEDFPRSGSTLCLFARVFLCVCVRRLEALTDKHLCIKGTMCVTSQHGNVVVE